MAEREPERMLYLWRGGPLLPRRMGSDWHLAMPSRWSGVAFAVRDRLQRGPVLPWRAPAEDPWRALRSVEDFEQCARAAAPVGARVRVRAAANDRRMPLGVVQVRVRGPRPLCRRLSKVELGAVHEALVEHAPVMLRLEVKS